MNKNYTLIASLLYVLIWALPVNAQDTTINSGENSFLTEKVQIPFGNTTRQMVGGTVTSISPDQFLDYDNVQNFGDLLAGRVPGLLGSRIRGMAGNVVTIVDGVLRDASDINIQAIDQITILRDANAGVLYGVHAPYGIILITTKKGQPGKPLLNIMAEQGMSAPVTLPRFLGSADYMRLYNEARTNDGLEPFFDEDIIAGHAGASNTFRYPDADYFGSEYVAKNRLFTKINSEFSGGNEVAQYYASLGWRNRGSLYNASDRNFGQNQFNIRSNVNINLSKSISAFLSGVAVFNVDEGSIGNFWQDASTLHPYIYSPLIPVDRIKHNADLSEGMSLDNVRLVDDRYLLGGTPIYQNNVYGNQALGSYETSIERYVQIHQGFNFDLGRVIDGLSFKTQISLDVLNSYTQGVYNDYAVYQPTWEGSGARTDSISAISRIGTDIRTGVQELGNVYFMRQLTTFGMFDYNRQFGHHSFSGVLLGYFDQRSEEMVLVPRKTAHAGLRISYAFQDKYFADFSSAYVNGYKLAPGNRGGFSPALSLGWVLSNESFMDGGSVFDFLKLNASGGIVNYEFGGTDYRLYEQTFGSYRGGFSWDDGNRSLSSITLKRAANPGLTFEKMKSVNVGIEGQVLNRSLYFNVNYFNTLNSGQVIQRGTYPSYLMNNIPYENYNETRYSGLEFSLDYTLGGGPFTARFGVTGMFAGSEQVRTDEVWLNSYQFREGRPHDAIFGLEAIGFFQDAGEIESGPIQMFGEVQPGDIKYRDQNGDGLIDDNDQIQIGDALPDFSYGLSVLLKYKAISLFAIGNGWQGGNGMYRGEYFWVQGDDKYSEEVLNRWTPATAATATYPRLSAGNSSNNFRESTHWLYDDNAFRISRIQLAYEFPLNGSSLNFVKGFHLFIRGENLVYLSGEAEKRQLRIGLEPDFRSYALGIKFKF